MSAKGLDQADPAQLLERARALAPLIAEAAPRIEAHRELTPEVVAALHEAGLFRMLIPRSLGGHEVAPVDYIQTIEEIAAADASTAWCIAQTSGASTMCATLDHEAAREIFTVDPRALLAVGPPNPSGRAIAVEDGFRLTGSWQFASGSRHATWMAAHCQVFDADGTPQLDNAGRPVERSLIFPKAASR